MKVILAPTVRECEVVAFERGIPPKHRDTVLVATDSPSAANKCRGLSLSRGDVIDAAHRGRFYDDIIRTLEPAFID